jgi:hypothetical protein
LERRNVSFSLSPAFPEILSSQKEAEGESKPSYLDEPKLDGQEKSHSQKNDECLGSPNDRSQEADDSLKNIHLFFVFFLPLYLVNDIFVESQKVIGHQTDDDQPKPEDVALKKSIESITEKADEKYEVKKGKNIIKHFPRLFIKTDDAFLSTQQKQIFKLPFSCRVGKVEHRHFLSFGRVNLTASASLQPNRSSHLLLMSCCLAATAILTRE